MFFRRLLIPLCFFFNGLSFDTESSPWSYLLGLFDPLDTLLRLDILLNERDRWFSFTSFLLSSAPRQRKPLELFYSNVTEGFYFTFRSRFLTSILLTYYNIFSCSVFYYLSPKVHEILFIGTSCWFNEADFWENSILYASFYQVG